MPASRHALDGEVADAPRGHRGALVVLYQCPDQDDERFGKFGERRKWAVHVVIRSAASYRLYLSPTSPRRTELLLRLPHAFDDLAITSGAIVAAYCSLAMQSQLVLDEPVTHRRATEVHREIGVAVGILMATADLTTEAAYNRLHGASRNLQRSLSDVARQVIAHGPLIEPPDADRLSNH